MADNRRFLDQAGLQLLLGKLTGKYDARYIAAADFGAAKVGYENNEHMSGVENVKQALDVLAANVVRQEGKLVEDGKAMQAVETKVDNLQTQVGVEAKDGASATGLVFRIGVLEELMGQNEEGTTGSFATRVSDLESEVDVLQAAIADGGAIEQRIQDNEDAIDAINNAENGILKQAKDYTDQQDQTAAQTQAQKDLAQDNRIKALEDDAPVKQAAIEAAQADADALEKRLDEEGGLVDRLEAAQAAIDDINDNANGILAQAKAYADSNKVAKADFEEFQEENTQAIANALQAAKDYADDEDAKIEAKLAGLKKDTVQAAIDDAEAAAKADAAAAKSAADSANSKIDAFMLAADVQEGAVDTLKEIQEYIGTHGQAADQMVKDITAAKKAGDDAQADVDALDAYVKGVEGAGGLEQRIAANEAFVKAQPGVDSAQNDRIKALEDSIADGGAVDARFDALETFKNEHSHAAFATTSAMEQADSALDLRIKAFEANGANDVAAIAGRVGDIETSIASGAVDQRFDAVEKAIDDLEALHAENGVVDQKVAAANQAAADAQADVDALADKVGTIDEGKTVAGLIADNAAAAKAADDKAVAAQGAVDDLEEVVGKKAADGQEATGIFLDIANLQADVDQNESDCDAAIKAEKEARETADQGLDTRVKAFEAGGAQDVAALAGRVSTLETITIMSEAEIDQVIDAIFPEQA